jgi:hypothetical protein
MRSPEAGSEKVLSGTVRARVLPSWQHGTLPTDGQIASYVTILYQVQRLFCII